MRKSRHVGREYKESTLMLEYHSAAGLVKAADMALREDWKKLIYY
jgi:hypothetical protein